MTTNAMTLPRVLVVAGSDSSGGARGGMLASTATIQVVLDALQKYFVATVVLDPVMVASSGAKLLPDDAVRSLREKLLPLTIVLTPNIPEAILLLHDSNVEFKPLNSLEDIKAVAKLLHGLGPDTVLLKGGHIPLTATYAKAMGKDESSIIVDILFDGRDFTTIESEFVGSKNTHGTGCSLASAIAANLSKHQPLPTAVRNACRYVKAGIRTSRSLGSGNGPINHFHSLQVLPFSPGSFVEYLLDREDVKPVWRGFTQHEFVRKIGDGTLSVDLFKSYMIQDYLYLTHFARTNALAGYKSMSMDVITASAEVVMHIQHEMKLRLAHCAEFGMSKEEIEIQKESQACVAYRYFAPVQLATIFFLLETSLTLQDTHSRWMLDIGNSQDWLALQMALASCLIGYRVAARGLSDSKESKEDGNPYWKWVKNYIADDYLEAVKKGSELLETFMVRQSPSRIEELVQIFIRATEMEMGFWEFGAHS